MRTFEYGSVYRKLPGGDSRKLSGYEEHPVFCLMMSGTSDKSWNGSARKSDFFLLKGYVELLLRRYGADLYNMWTESAPADIFSEGVVYKLPGDGRVLATVGTVAPAFAKRFGVKQAVVAAEIDWRAFFLLVKRDKVAFRELPRFPEVRRDLALLLDEGVPYADLRACALKNAKKLLRSVGLFDVYRGDKIPAGKKQYALSFILRDDDRTLTDADVELTMGRIMDAFAKEFGASLR
jgi:phenylalanyl-tRNA synthetase beta chain